MADDSCRNQSVAKEMPKERMPLAAAAARKVGFWSAGSWKTAGTSCGGVTRGGDGREREFSVRKRAFSAEKAAREVGLRRTGCSWKSEGTSSGGEGGAYFRPEKGVCLLKNAR